MRKRIKVIFTVSILANILLLGTVVGMAIDKHNHAPFEEAKEDLSPEGQKLVAESFQDAKKNKDMVLLFKEAGDARRYITRVMMAEKFDESTFDAAFKRLRKSQDQITDRKTKASKELMGKLSPEDRKAFAEHMARSFSWRSCPDRPMPQPNSEQKSDK